MYRGVYRGQTLDENGDYKWVLGFLVHDRYYKNNNNEYIIMTEDSDYYIYEETIGQFTNQYYYDNKKCYEDDIAFEEIEYDWGDERIYFVCTWINELSSFAWLNLEGEYHTYINGEWDITSDENIDTFCLLDTHKLHYAGNIHDNPGLLYKL